MQCTILINFFIVIFLYSPYDHVSSPSANHPYNNQPDYYIPKPDIQLVYGFPNILPSKQTPPTYPTELKSIDYITTTTTDPNTVENDSTTILTGDSLTKRKKRSLSHSQPQLVQIPTTTTRPRTRYNDEGKWRIIRQEENKQDKKYDYL